MAIALPSSPTWRSGRWRLISNAATFTSPINRVSQSVQRIGDLWACVLELPPMKDDAAREWAATLALMSGGRNAAYLGPPLRNVFAGAVGSPLVNGTDLVGATLPVDGATSGLVVPKGTFVSYDTDTFRMLHITTAAVTLTGGAGSLPIWPAIRKSPADNAPVNFTTPTCEMRLENPDADLISLTDSFVYGQSIPLVEAVRQ